MIEFKTVIFGRYVLGGGLGSWAKSFERGVKRGEMRCIGGIAMYAYTIYPRWFRAPEVNWCPIDRELCHDFDKLKVWMTSL